MRLGLWRVGGAYVARRTGGDSSRRFDANRRRLVQEGPERGVHSSIRAESILKKFRKFLQKVGFFSSSRLVGAVRGRTERGVIIIINYYYYY